MGYAIAYISKKDGKRAKLNSLRTLIATSLGIVIMIAGYTIFGAILYGSIASGIAQVPGLTLEGVLGMVLFYLVAFALEGSKLVRHSQIQK